MKKLAGRDFEDLLQCVIPVFAAHVVKDSFRKVKTALLLPF
jgi:hypothetical protein